MKERLKSEDYHPYTAGFIPHQEEQVESKFNSKEKYNYSNMQMNLGSENRMMKKIDSNDSEPLSPFEKLTLKHKA